MKKKIVVKLLSLVSVFSILFNLFYTPLYVLAQETGSQTDQSTPAPTLAVETDQTPEATYTPEQNQTLEATSTPESTPTPETTSTPESTPTLQPTSTAEPTSTPELTPTPEPTPSEEPLPGPPPIAQTPAPIEKICLTDGQEIKDSVNEGWNIDDEKGIAETKEEVKLGVKYIFPLENKVSVTFKCLPKDESLRTTLKIQQIKVSDLKLPEGTNPYGEYAYDITTGMSDGTFEYDITLPKPEDRAAEVSYIEKTAEEIKNQPEPLKDDELKPVDEEKLNQEGDKLSVRGLDHFTIFIVDDGDTNYSDNGWSSHGTGYSGDHHWVMPSQSGKVATWIFSGSAGEYAILPSWVIWNDHATNAHYTSTDISGFDITVNQKQPANGSITSTSNGTWSGWYPNTNRYNLDPGDTVSLSVESETDGNLAADAMAFVNLNEIYVNKSWSGKVVGDYLGDGKIFGINAFSTIQDGINQVTSGGTINVAAGNYKENIIVNKSLVLQGNNSTINPNTSIIRNSESVVEGQISVYSGGVTIKGFTITNPSYSGETIKGVHIYNIGTVISNINIQNNILTNIYNANNKGSYGIMVQGAVNAVNILDNLIENIDSAGWAHGIEVTPSSASLVVPTQVTITGNRIANISNTSHLDEYAFSVDFASPTNIADASQITFSNNIIRAKVRNVDSNHELNAIGNNWGTTNLDEIEAMINQNCNASPFVHGTCDSSDNTFYGFVKYANIEIPTNLGWNLQSRSATPNETPVDLDCSAGTVYTNENSVAHNWSAVNGSNVKYQREVTYPSGSIGYFEAGSNTYTLFSTFGGTSGIEGLWKTRVRAYVDANSNNTPDTNEETSDWSNECKIIYDKTAPTSSIFFQGDLDETKDITTNNRWFESFDNLDLKINVGDQSADKINYQILDGDVACPAQSSEGYTAVAHNTNLAPIVNAKPDGVYSLCYFASDLAGNKESIVHKELLKKDSTKPSFTIDSVSGNLFDGVYYNKTDITVQITVNDAGSGYSHARYDLYSADSNHTCTTFIGWNQDMAPSVTNPISRTLTKSGLVDGNYCLRVWVYDQVQNKGWTDSSGHNGWIKFTIDNTAPTTPSNLRYSNSLSDSISCNGFTNQFNVTAKWDPSTDTNLSHYEYKSFNPPDGWVWNGGNVGNVTSRAGAFTMGEGTYGFAVRAVDLAGNASPWTSSDLFGSCQITYDITAPHEGSLVINNGDLYTNSRGVVLSVFASDAASGVVQMAFSNGGPYSNWEPYATTKNWTLADSDGEKTVRVKFKDAADNENSSYLASDTIILDRIDPISSPTSPSAGFYNASTWDGKINGTASDSMSGVKKVEISVKVVTPENETKYWDGDSWGTEQVWLTATGTTSWSYAISAPIEGTYTFYSKATDNAGNTEETGVLGGVVYDITPPTASWVNPGDGDTLVGVVLLNVATGDNLSGVGGTQIFFKPAGDESESGTEIAGASWDTSYPLPLGEYDLIARVADKAGNKNEKVIKVGVAAVVSNEKSATPTQTTAVVTWTTDRPTSSRVVYDTVPHSTLGSPPNYGYAFSTGTINTSPKVTNHTVEITGLTDGTIYYYRTISEGSPVALGVERSFKTLTYAGPPSGGGAGVGGGAVAGAATEATLAPATSGSVEGISLQEGSSQEGEGKTKEEVLGEEAEATPTPAPEEKTGGILGQAVKFAKDRTKITLLIVFAVGLVLYFAFKFLKKRKG